MKSFPNARLHALCLYLRYLSSWTSPSTQPTWAIHCTSSVRAAAWRTGTVRTAGRPFRISRGFLVDCAEGSILDVPYDSNPLTFLEIRKDLAEMTGDEKVTVPTLKTEDGYTIDSYKVAEYVS